MFLCLNKIFLQWWIKASAMKGANTGRLSTKKRLFMDVLTGTDLSQTYKKLQQSHLELLFHFYGRVVTFASWINFLPQKQLFEENTSTTLCDGLEISWALLLILTVKPSWPAINVYFSYSIKKKVIFHRTVTFDIKVFLLL